MEMKPGIRSWLPLAVAIAAIAAAAPVQPASAQDAAQVIVRLGQLEEQVRTLSGRVEQLQFENRRLTEQLQKFQQDVEFRLQEGGPAASAASSRQRQGSASGAAGAAPAAADGLARAREHFQQGQYGEAEMSLRQFLQANPKDRRVAEAIYWLGESYYQQRRYSEAAEQFLKVTTEHARASRGPDALLKLGMSLSRLNAKPEACATLAEVVRKYPSASAEVRAAVERERRRTKC